MEILEQTHPEVYQQFCAGCWTVQQQARYGFSGTACDQVIEQTLNRDTKSSGGITKFSLNRNAVYRWIMTQSDRALMTRECEKMSGLHRQPSHRKDLDVSTRKKNTKQLSKMYWSVLKG